GLRGRGNSEGSRVAAFAQTEDRLAARTRGPAEPSVRALGEEGDEHHQIADGEKPLVGLLAGRLGGASDKTKMAAARKIVQMIDPDTCQGSNFCIGKDLLPRFHCNHGWASLSLRRKLASYSI